MFTLKDFVALLNYRNIIIAQMLTFGLQRYVVQLCPRIVLPTGIIHQPQVGTPDRSASAKGAPCEQMFLMIP